MKLRQNKYLMLIFSLLFDALGYVSFLIPGLGDFSDIAWAPAAAFIMTKLYKGKAGKIGAAVAFIEEALPGLDIIPTFTIMWLYTYVIKSKSDANEVETIDV